MSPDSSYITTSKGAETSGLCTYRERDEPACPWPLSVPDLANPKSRLFCPMSNVRDGTSYPGCRSAAVS